tara:strand:+ start:1921 stop:2139 length:219 start_codon:yes stop_codon:yes gene_type:complete
MKTRIKVVDGTYCPEYRSWGMWFSIVVGHSRSGDNYHYTSVLTEAEAAIDKDLKRFGKKAPVTSIIEYPLND